MTGPEPAYDPAEQAAQEAEFCAAVFELPSFYYTIEPGTLIVPCLAGCAQWYAAVQADPDHAGGIVMREWHDWGCRLIQDEMAAGWRPYHRQQGGA